MRPQLPGNAAPQPGAAGTGWAGEGPASREIPRAASGGPATTGTGAETPWTGSPGTQTTGTGSDDSEKAGTGSAGTGTSGTGTSGTGTSGTESARTRKGRPGSSGAGTGAAWTGPAWTGSARTGTTGAGAGAGGTGTTGTGASGTEASGAGASGTGAGLARQYGPDRAAIRPAPGHAREAAHAVAPATRRAAESDAARLPWYEVAHAKRVAEGYQNCGPLERVLRREWPPSKVPSAPVVRAVNRLAELPLIIKQILAAGVDAIHVGEGGVPELDDMSRLRGVPLPGGRATWDACAGAYGEKKIIVGSRPSSAPDVMCHEVGHALDDVDRERGRWQSDSAEFRRLYERCEGSLVSDFHRQAGDLGRREFFADAFAAIASRQRPALVDMLGGNIRTALDVMLYFNLRYGL
jgi:hypothetical protein